MYNRFLRFVSMVLALVILIQTTSVLEIAASAASAFGETANEITSEPEILGEDISKREESVKHFKMSDGTYLAVSYAEPVHYQTENGSWQEIDNTLKEATQQLTVPMAAVDTDAAMTASIDGSMELSASAYVNTSNDFGVSLPEILNEQSWVGTFHSGHSLYFRFENIGQSEASVDSPAAQEMDTFSQATTVRTSGSVTYENILPGVDVLYQLNGQQLKENILFDALVNTPDSLSFVLWAENLELSALEDGGYIFTADGETCFVLPAPYMVDSHGESSGAIQIVVEEIDSDTYRFTYVPDRQWLQAEDRGWPVVLDPVTCADATVYTVQDTFTAWAFG